MSKNKKFILFISVSILIAFIVIACIKVYSSPKKIETDNKISQNVDEKNEEENLEHKHEAISENSEKIEKTKIENLINISDCSEEFMEEYFDSFKNLNTDNNSENILIVTAKEKINETYGSIDIVEGPNNQYFIKYESESKKNDALKLMKQDDKILYVGENNIYTTSEKQYNSWGIKKMGLDLAINNANEKYREDLLNEVTIAIIDTGCNMDLFNENYTNKIKETYNIFDNKEMYDGYGHGTHIAGTIAEGTSDNVNIIPVKVSNTKELTEANIIAAINYITYYQKANIINMSFGYNQISPSMYIAIEAAEDLGIISVAAAGNNKTSKDSYPAALDNTISVSAVDSNMELASFSNYGNKIDFSAPGVDIESINGTMSGTSMATPHVVCACSIIKSININASLEEIKTLLKNTAIDLGTPGWDRYFGYGFINVSNYDEIYSNTKKTNNLENIVDFTADEVTIESPQFGNITNLMNMTIELTDELGNQEIKYLSELDNLTIENYDPFLYGTQIITIKYNGIEKNITINNNVGFSPYGLKYYDAAETMCIIYDIGKKLPKKVYIPEYIDEMKVVGFEPGIFNDTMVETIILPSSITEIKENSFKDNGCIKAIKGGPAEIAVGDNAFCNAYKLQVFEPKISSLGKNAFEEAWSIDNIILSDNIRALEEAVFKDCVSLKNIKLPNNIEEIKKEAFANTGIKDLYIPKSLTQISEFAFLGTQKLETIKVDDENPIFDSRDNSNALIDTYANFLILGAGKTIISDTVIEIYNFAFYNNKKIEKIKTNNVIAIREGAFEGCTNLKEIYINEPAKEIYGLGDSYGLEDSAIYIYNPTLYNDVFNQTGYKFNTIVLVKPYEENIIIESEKEYSAFDKINDLSINITYMGRSNVPENLKEKITEGYTITYENGRDHFEVGDTYFIVSATTKYDINISKKVEVAVKKAVPKYNIPQDLSAKYGQKLSEIELPKGFEWMNEDEELLNAGECVFKAKYVPEDTINYEIVENIDITISVNEKEPEVNPSKLGDLNGDGKVNIKDWNRMYKHINETLPLTDEELAVADLNNDGKVNIKDWNRMYRHITEVEPLW